MSIAVPARCGAPRLHALAAAIALIGLAPGAVLAQARPAAATLAPVVVTGNPLRSADTAAPVSGLSGDALVTQRGSSLGETLAALPGVAAGGIAPNASRPVIRGLDGERVRMLSNAGASFDASGLSFDHAVPIDPLIVERVEVLRGPGALLYGGSAVGGVVNAIDNRIPQQRLDAPGGALELRAGGAAGERGGAAVVEAGKGPIAWHADVFARETGDVRVPAHRFAEDGVLQPETRRVRNSASRTRGGAVGATWFGRDAQLGLSLDTYDSRYGIVAEPDVGIRMQRDHLGLAGEWRAPVAGLERVRWHGNLTRYEHREVEGDGTVGTTFRNRGAEWRVEAEHRPVGPWRGVLGAQIERSRFSALGDEAFVPGTATRSDALFALEEARFGRATWSLGARLEHNRVRSDGDGPDAPEPRFGAAAERRFALRSVSLGHVFALAPGWSVAASLNRTERAPTAAELFADGLHAATGSVERGDPTLGPERGVNLDLALQWRQGPSRWRAGVYATRFARFIALRATGTEVEIDGQPHPEYRFTPVRARLAGFEIEGRQRLVERPWTLDLGVRLDRSTGRDLDHDEPLPRLAPLRLLLSLDAARGPWGARLELDHAARQSQVPATDQATPGYTLLNASLTRRFNTSRAEGLWFVKLTNLGDRLATSAVVPREVRDVSPLPGRALKAGVRFAF